MEKQIDYLTEFDKHFRSEKQCLDYLFELRWSAGYKCPKCPHTQYWQIGEKKYKCRKCGYQATVTAGTLFQDSHLPLLVWFRAIWIACHETGIINAKAFQQQLGLGSYRTAWTLLQKIRKVMGECNPAKLGGVLLISKINICKKVSSRANLIIAIEIQSDGSTGNICIDINEDGYDSYYPKFLEKHAKEGSTIVNSMHSLLFGNSYRNSPFKYVEKHIYLLKSCGDPMDVVTTQLKEMGLMYTQTVKSSTEQLHLVLGECCYKYNQRNKTNKYELFEEIVYSALLTDPHTYSQIIKKPHRSNL